MPYIDLPNENVSMFYRTNLPHDGSIQHLNPSHPTILLLPGNILDSRDMSALFSSPLLSPHYNLISLEARSIGQTKNEPLLCRDQWTDAADYVKAMDVLGVGKWHVFASFGTNVSSALRMAVLWPQKVLSLTLLGIDTPDVPAFVDESWKELNATYMHAKDLEDLEMVINEIMAIPFSYLPDDTIDMVARYWETLYPPTKSTRLQDFVHPQIMRIRLPLPVLASIRAPVLLINGGDEHCIITSPQEARNMQGWLTGAAGGAKLHIIADGPDHLHMLPQFSNEVVSTFSTFLSSLPPSPSPSHTHPSNSNHMLTALRTLSHLPTSPSDILTRDPHLSSSFSCVPPHVQEERRVFLEELAELEKVAFSPFGPGGEMPRRFTERNHGVPLWSPIITTMDKDKEHGSGLCLHVISETVQTVEDHESESAVGLKKKEVRKMTLRERLRNMFW